MFFAPDENKHTVLQSIQEGQWEGAAIEFAVLRAVIEPSGAAIHSVDQVAARRDVRPAVAESEPPA